MNDTPFSKIKKIASTASSAVLLRVNLAAEESRLKGKYQTLGEKLHKAVKGDLLQSIKDDPTVVELLGAIEEGEKRIAELKERMEAEGDREED